LLAFAAAGSSPKMHIPSAQDDRGRRHLSAVPRASGSCVTVWEGIKRGLKKC
jgi:hypothetical protein